MTLPQVCFRWPPAQAAQGFDFSSFASAHNRFLTGSCISGTVGALFCCFLTTPHVCLRCDPAHAAQAELLAADDGLPPSAVALMLPQGDKRASRPALPPPEPRSCLLTPLSEWDFHSHLHQYYTTYYVSLQYSCVE